ncbi:hypothetical protein KW805_02115 [Candidatus Pacearchaeota archaeon]|nr:hypothetical protein [Candidatus Pacearchaeota archaeon]
MVRFSSKHAFWQALVFTLIVFGLGIVLGYFLESSRADNVQMNLLHSEVDLLDEQLRSIARQDFNVSCAVSVHATFQFADRVYGEAAQLEEYDTASKFSDVLYLIHKRYDLLRMMLWTESVELKKQCPQFHTVVYMYAYKTNDLNVKAEQMSLSHVLQDLKQQHPDVLLIPIAGDLQLNSVDLVLQSYTIHELPVIIIDEKQVVSQISSSSELEKYLTPLP